jgi:Na+/H+ antiporter NhaD/arsenite permease-like protein
MKPEFIVLGIILSGAVYCFWTQRLRTDVTALVVMLSLAFPWPRADGKWSGVLTPQEAFAGFGSVAVIMVAAMFVFSAALVRTGAAEMVGGRLFRACADNELLLQLAVFALATLCSMFINETTIVIVFMPVILEVCKERNLSPSRYLLCTAYGLAHVTRVATLGELTASIAHEINQPLAAVVSNANASLRWLSRDSPNLAEACEAIRRIIRDGKYTPRCRL